MIQVLMMEKLMMEVVEDAFNNLLAIIEEFSKLTVIRNNLCQRAPFLI